MSAIAKLEQRVEAARHTVRQIEQQHSKSGEDLIGLLKEVKESVNQKQAEMIETQAQFERVIDEYAQLKDLLHSLVLTLEASRRSRLGDMIQDLDAKVGDSEFARPVSGELADHNAVLAENFAEVDPNHVRLGLHRVLKKNRDRAPKVAEAEEAAT